MDEIILTERAQNMVDSAPDYYNKSKVYLAVQNAIANELDLLSAKRADIQDQLNIETATWGLKYWENELGIPTIETDDYATRRARVMAIDSGAGRFSAELIKTICEAYAGQELQVIIRESESEIRVVMWGEPLSVADLQAQIENIVHAHYGVVWEFRQLTWNDLEASNAAWLNIEQEGLTWNLLSSWRPQLYTLFEMTWNVLELNDIRWNDIELANLTWEYLATWIPKRTK